MDTNTLIKEKANGQMQLVTFSLNNEEFALDIFRVREINKMIKITVIPNAAGYVEGIINLRGTVIPVINLNEKLNMTYQNKLDASEIIVVEIKNQLVGLIVDNVNQVIRISSDDISETPEAAVNLNFDINYSVVNLDDRLIILLNIDSLLSRSELSDLQQAV